ncbi:PQQ-dependent sugar dehydrogenase [Variovorax sp.]|uniref:PQQ-dependent sugar dehydrogenase n=1 Tax=Variovorax sp. TaxID=1871043 RepID=UPI002D55899E|nr:PQQ-dependent sugar dehydrogenase [Variovorax sp.]HYP85587.1 PQQ-dependent sugar dehydrogenase [Variovorax sp.]
MKHSTLLRQVLVVACGLAGAGAWASSADSAAEALDGPSLSTFAANLERPWGMEFLPDGRLLVTERPGRLRVISADGLAMSDAVHGVPEVDFRDLGGLLDVRVDPHFAHNRLIYLSFTKAGRGLMAGRNSLTVARARLSEDVTRLEKFKVLFRQTPYVANGENLGGRLAISADGHLFLTVGDRYAPQDRMRAQSLAFYQGKTVRIRTDGVVPADNPFAHRPGARPEIWSLGHRNPQGALVDPRTGLLWTAEHGPQGGDEINIIHKGHNYGWPVVTYGCEYVTCAPIGEGTAHAGMDAPLVHWGPPSIAPSNLIFYSGRQFPQWNGNLFVGAMTGKAVWRIELGGDARAPQVLGREPLFGELGERIRDIRQGPDGGLYLLTDGENARVVRVARQEAAH